jgi:hypothetical protein
MSEDQGRRLNVHPVMFTAELEMALVKLQAQKEIGKSPAVLYLVVEGAFRLGYLGQEDYDLLIKRYSRKLVDVTKEKRAQREDSHTKVRVLEQQKQKEELDRKDNQLKGMLEAWETHQDPRWRARALAEAERFKDKLESARALLSQGQKEGSG